MQVAHYRKSLISVFQEFLLVLTKFLFWQEHWALGYYFFDFS